MTTPSPGTAEPQRPVYYEAQILAAADLTAAVEHARDHAARHDRHLHDWGIAAGLGLSVQPTGEDDAVTVTLQPGVAIDGTGREVVVPGAVTLSEAQFAESVGSGSADGASHPVFLSGLDRAPVAGSFLDDGQADRVDESYQLRFRRAGDERLVTEQQAPESAAGPGDGTDPWLILIGYVTWRAGHFTGLGTAGSVPVRFAGVRADTVAARSGTLALRARPEPAQGGAVLTVADTSGLVFGRYLADGSVDPLLTVTPDGDLTVRGTGAAQRPGATAVVSGVATDGTILPLPAGVDPAKVTSGTTVLHVTVTPHTDGTPPSADGVWLPGQVECGVDDARRVRCRTRWLRIDTDARTWRDLPGAASFTVIATAAEQGSGA
ncbi:hypothetical protein [Actinoplanes sp. NPDC051851]|uniref:hypothetical protein n=1 Tax=Actinoplanes sp. NPDC051851 TaxID=3154753 RepID=UPI00342EB2F0